MTLLFPDRKARKEEAEPNTHGLPTGGRLRAAVKRLFRDQHTAILRYLRTGKKAAGGGGDPLPPAWPGWDDFGLGAEKNSERMTPLLKLTWEDAAAAFAPRVGLDPDEWSVINPLTEKLIDQAALDFCESTNSTTSMQLDAALAKTREELKAGVVEKGESVDVLTKRVNAIFDQAEKWRARRIAQTETSRAVHSAQEQAAIESGVVKGWEWLLSSDACPLCHKIADEAKYVKLGQAFAVIGKNPKYSEVRHPPAHPSCNCTVVEVLDVDPDPSWAQTLQDPKPEPKPEPDRAPRPDAAVKPPSHPDGAPKFPAARKLKVKEPRARGDRKELAAAAVNVFGKRRTPEQLAAIAGAPDGAEVSFRASADPESSRGAIDFVVSHPSIERYHGVIEKIDGQVVLTIDRLNVSPALRGQGVGTAIHGRMVDWASRLGVDRLELWASAADGDNGYVTWPVLGYNGPLTAYHRSRLSEPFSQAAKLQELLDLPDGRDAWQAARLSIQTTFELEAGSEDRQRWTDYWKRQSTERRQEIMDRSRGKSEAKFPPFDPARAVPNSLGMTAEEIAEGYASLAAFAAERVRRGEPRDSRPIKILSPRLRLLAEAQARGEDADALHRQMADERYRRLTQPRDDA